MCCCAQARLHTRLTFELYAHILLIDMWWCVLCIALEYVMPSRTYALAHLYTNLYIRVEYTIYSECFCAVCIRVVHAHVLQSRICTATTTGECCVIVMQCAHSAFMLVMCVCMHVSVTQDYIFYYPSNVRCASQNNVMTMTIMMLHNAKHTDLKKEKNKRNALALARWVHTCKLL